MSNERIKVWITKYALSKGIQLMNGEICNDIGIEMLKYSHGGLSQYVHGDEWHRTPEAALARAGEMRTKKIASLKKSIAKLESMKFDVPQGN